MKPVNGHNIDDEVLVLRGSGFCKPRKMLIRQLGLIGFYVRGLATCFYWTEKGVTWDEISPEERKEEHV
jgi:hypothetical protein